MNGVTLQRPRPPSLTPRLLLATGAGAAALVLWSWLAVFVLLASLVYLALRAPRATRRGLFWTLVVFAVATVTLTPLWLHLLADVPVDRALAVAAARALRLDAVLAVGFALGVALPPVSWLAALRRFPRLALVLTITFRQVPELGEEAARIRMAQRARGLTFAPLVARPAAIVVPLVVRSLERAERLGEALALAGWSRARPGDPVVRTAHRGGDLALVSLGLLLLAVALWRLVNLA